MTATQFVPADFEVPAELVCADFALIPLGPEHNEADYVAWISSIEHIHSTPGFAGRPWPEPMAKDDNLRDLQGHADDFRLRRGFTYSVVEPSGEVIGCVYIYPATETTADADVRSWVRADRSHLDRPLHNAVSEWLRSAWPFATFDYAPREGA